MHLSTFNFSNMAIFKKIGIRILGLAALLVLMNFVYEHRFFEADIQKHSEIIELVRDVQDDARIIYLGESSNITFRSDDTDKRSISEFISDHYPEVNFGHLTKPASHAGIYKVLLNNIPEDSPVETVIITLNLRSFNAQWIYSDLETPFQKSIVLLRNNPPLLNRFMLAFKDHLTFACH